VSLSKLFGMGDRDLAPSVGSSATSCEWLYMARNMCCDGCEDLAEFLVAGFLDERLGRGNEFLQPVKSLESVLWARG